MRTNERYIEALRYMDVTMRGDIAAGHQWRYSNSSKKQGKGGFEQKRKTGHYYTNCCQGVWMGLEIAGIPKSALHWYGIKGGKIYWQNDKAKAEAEKYFEIIQVGNKKVSWLFNNNKLCDGDILLGYQSMGHTNCYLGGNQSFDSGHAFCSGSGEGAAYKKWIGNLTCKNNKVNWILRLKDRSHYRVQCGAFFDANVCQEIAQTIREKGFPVTVFEEDGMHKIQAGYFSGKTNAEKLASAMSSKGIASFIKEV